MSRLREVFGGTFTAALINTAVLLTSGVAYYLAVKNAPIVPPEIAALAIAPPAAALIALPGVGLGSAFAGAKLAFAARHKGSLVFAAVPLAAMTGIETLIILAASLLASLGWQGLLFLPLAVLAAPLAGLYCLFFVFVGGFVVRFFKKPGR
jgi:hypothetical protein